MGGLNKIDITGNNELLNYISHTLNILSNVKLVGIFTRS